ncbi:cytochrome c-type biogenesis protein CcmH [Gilvimarinus sp. SDUM040013]|uniref:Cytochrome c-type biogenesis protein n=1 Tax=Gilvimarinus gilvus TaxID=3058038 RepID=A0ABU4S0B4_9GAMM|nr:cytochrome c-type biogenesis protein [Gilvimarinus sp. SDUM040013]MDO3385583.1 cytochrome c-type biogenesis protein CcmH [Gilvimarinus sp. SDUM040013]MDX6849917.1 cytochrome c-type biogenesis protein [Gilvimarinus sp. SDUM040013]
MRLVLFLLGCLLAGSSLAEQIYQFDDPVDRARFKQFNEELRCPQCQNQNLAGSDSIVSESVRQDLYEQILAGRSDKEITDDMVRRYGNYILYKPPFKPATAALWLSPLILLGIGSFVLWRMVRRRARSDDGELSAADEDAVNQLVKKYSDKQVPK